MDLLNKVAQYIEQAKDGLQVEHPKLEFKSRWYDFSNKKDLNEFLKDSTAIANTFGLDGYIIIGFDEKSKTFVDSKFSDSKLKDSSNIIGILNKRIDELFEITIQDYEYKGHNISVIHIPPSLSKPHVIKNYQAFHKDGKIKSEVQNRIFVRKETGIFPASKYDIDLMYYDRKNIIPEYELKCYYSYETLSFHRHEDLAYAKAYLTFENTGRRPITIARINWNMFYVSDPSLEDVYLFKTLNLLGKNLVIVSGEMINTYLEFYSQQSHIDQKSIRITLNKQRENIMQDPLSIELANNKTLIVELIKVTKNKAM